MNPKYNITKLNNRKLMEGIKHLASQERKAQALFLAHLAEVDRRKLYAESGYSSLYKYLTQELNFTEGSACKRMQVAKTAKKYPIIYSLLEEGKIHMEAISLLTPLLTEENHKDILNKATFKTKREIEKLVATLKPKSDVPDQIRKLPEKPRAFAGECCKNETFSTHPDPIHAPNQAIRFDSQAPRKREEEKPLSETRIMFKFTGSETFRKKIERAKEVLRHKYPAGKLEDIFEEALEALLEKKDMTRKISRKSKQKKTKELSITTKKPAQNNAKYNPQTRYIPQHVRYKVWQRDNGQCTYTSPTGKRCCEKGGLEFDHTHPFGLGGSSNNPNNIRLLCKTHNQLAARKMFGDPYIDKYAR